MKEIIDADEFVLMQIYRPFQTTLGLGEERLKKQPYDNNKTIELLQQDTEWARIVKDRIIRCKFKFNKWIDHPVINYIKTLY